MLNKKWKKFLFALWVIFFLYSALWCADIIFRYEPLRKKLDAAVDCSTSIPQGDGCIIRDGYTYSIFKPRFLSFNWNLHISENIIISDDLFEETTVDLLIKPYGINDYKVGLGITKTTIDHDEYSIQTISTDMMLDKNMNLLDDTPENRELYEQNLDKIENLYHLAYEMWGILEPE